MQVALRNRSTVATILVIVMLAAALAIVCSDGIHLPVPGSVSGACITMPHSSLLAATIGAGGEQLAASLMFAIVAGFAAVFFSTRLAATSAGSGISPGRRIDPLNGRLRL